MRPAAHPDEWRPVTPGDDESIDQLSLQEPWTEAQYLRLTRTSRQLLEFTDGRLDVLPMPTDQHQVIVRFLLLALFPRALELGGTVLFAPLRLRIRDGKFREPDLLLVLDANDPRRGNDFWTGADLVVEVVSPDDPGRDTRDKRLDYAEAGIPEYWIVNPLDETVTVLELRGTAYAAHGVFRRGQQADSVSLGDCFLDVASMFDAK
jgi:Uma2 family endonuclease